MKSWVDYMRASVDMKASHNSRGFAQYFTDGKLLFIRDFFMQPVYESNRTYIDTVLDPVEEVAAAEGCEEILTIVRVIEPRASFFVGRFIDRGFAILKADSESIYLVKKVA